VCKVSVQYAQAYWNDEGQGLNHYPDPVRKIAMIYSAYLDEPSFSLSHLSHFEIENPAEGLDEPSGLAFSHGKNALWTISDDTKKIFKLSLDGDLKKNKSFKIPDKGLEGIALDPTGEFLFVVKEDDNRLVPVDNSLIFINFMSLLRAKRTDPLTNRFFLLSIWPV